MHVPRRQKIDVAAAALIIDDFSRKAGYEDAALRFLAAANTDRMPYTASAEMPAPPLPCHYDDT